MKINFWRERIYHDLNKKAAEKILSFYGLTGTLQLKPLYGGWRKACFLVRLGCQESFTLAIYPPGTLSAKQIEKAVFFEQMAGERGFPCRKVYRTKRGKLFLVHRSPKGKFFAVLYSYLPGRMIYPYQEKQISETAFWLAKLHQAFLKENGRTLVHGDFGRGNLLFNRQGKLCGIIDFEETKWGEARDDLEKTLSFLKQDCPQIEPRIIKDFKDYYERWREQK